MIHLSEEKYYEHYRRNKKTINYTDKPCARCDRCKHSTETENLYVDRMWDRVCNVAVVQAFAFSDNGRCDRFEQL